ncbi:amidohydrolase family protein [Corynebacterium felinum]|uniref:N-acetylglucosamine-6-phosphate deacetylase n=1 Tax=Corynebacterium felinum TaxID=131318 RepID=A0ABU2BCI9_9CORY|nr:amidohydrolase family protein [Corynebacterium felinum]MDF5821544.1 amidohydrolase family protein [Corynebacterium felinum]MDR7355099.1 N-acetylglucosamine-6-phosphate deacetylase [Corynebacterium felinum]WJY94449.1 N-acetylglucosamine-6-phosphate deacetylase [Corynebacterium felinum]
MSTHFSGRIVTADGITASDMTVTDGVITHIHPREDTGDLPLIVPGYTDIHNHGGAGESFPTSDLDGCRKAARFHARNGTTSMLASLVSATENVLLKQTEILADLTEEGEILGIHLEGPFVNICKCGAQDPAAIIPGDPDMLERIADRGRGHIRSITFAPETANARALVDICAERNIIVSLGHTDADSTTCWDIISYALERGATITATHLFNAMPQIHHRNPGAATALLDAATQGLVTVELVADGVHLDDDIVNMVRNAAPRHAMFITDAMAAAGLGDGSYILGALPVTVDNKVARLTEGGAIAGGTSVLHDQLQRHLRCGWELEDMIPLLTTNAATLLGTNAGALEVGKDANFIIMSDTLTISEVYRLGNLIT